MANIWSRQSWSSKHRSGVHLPLLPEGGGEGSAKRVTDSIETALHMAGGLVIVKNMETGEEKLMNENFACADCGCGSVPFAPGIA